MDDCDFKEAGYGWCDDRFKGEPCTGAWQRSVYGDEHGHTTLYTLTAYRWDWPRLNSRGAPDVVEYEWELWMRPRNDRWCSKVTISWTRSLTIAEVEGIAVTIWNNLAGPLDLRPAKEDDE